MNDVRGSTELAATQKGKDTWEQRNVGGPVSRVIPIADGVKWGRGEERGTEGKAADGEEEGNADGSAAFGICMLRW